MALTRRKLNSIALFSAMYMGLGTSAIAAGLATQRTEVMDFLTIHDTPQPVTATEFTDFQGAPLSLTDYHGKVVLLNFWATWCAPCREEMPMLSTLQTDLGGDDFEVLTIATGRNPAPSVTRFFERIGVDNLPLYRDQDKSLANGFKVLALPTTVILDKSGQEVARLEGSANWSSTSAKQILQAFIDK